MTAPGGFGGPGGGYWGGRPWWQNGMDTAVRSAVAVGGFPTSVGGAIEEIIGAKNYQAQLYNAQSVFGENDKRGMEEVQNYLSNINSQLTAIGYSRNQFIGFMQEVGQVTGQLLPNLKDTALSAMNLVRAFNLDPASVTETGSAFGRAGDKGLLSTMRSVINILGPSGRPFIDESLASLASVQNQDNAMGITGENVDNGTLALFSMANAIGYQGARASNVVSNFRQLARQGNDLLLAANPFDPSKDTDLIHWQARVEQGGADVWKNLLTTYGNQLPYLLHSRGFSATESSRIYDDLQKGLVGLSSVTDDPKRLLKGTGKNTEEALAQASTGSTSTSSAIADDALIASDLSQVIIKYLGEAITFLGKGGQGVANTIEKQGLGGAIQGMIHSMVESAASNPDRSPILGVRKAHADTVAHDTTSNPDHSKLVIGPHADVSGMSDIINELAKRHGSGIITNGYRDPKHNKAVGGAPNSKHLEDLALDMVFHSDAERDRTLKILADMGGTIIDETKPGMGTAPHWHIQWNKPPVLQSDSAKADSAMHDLINALNQNTSAIKMTRSPVDAVRTRKIP